MNFKTGGHDRGVPTANRVELRTDLSQRTPEFQPSTALAFLRAQTRQKPHAPANAVTNKFPAPLTPAPRPHPARTALAPP